MNFFKSFDSVSFRYALIQQLIKGIDMVFTGLSVPLLFTLHYANTPLQYTAIFYGCKNVHFQMNFFNIFLIFAQNIDCGYTLEPPQSGGSIEAVLTSTHNLCFGAKIRKKVYPI